MLDFRIRMECDYFQQFSGPYDAENFDRGTPSNTNVVSVALHLTDSRYHLSQYFYIFLSGLLSFSVGGDRRC